MFRNSLRVLCVIGLVLSLSMVTVVMVDASPGLDRSGGVVPVKMEQTPGILGWFEALIERLLTVLVGADCDPATDPQCTAGDGGASADVNG